MKTYKNKGFSLIEVMIAAGLLATVTVTVCTLGAKSLASMRVCQEYEKAWDVLDRQLILLEQVGVGGLASRPSLSGVIKDPQSEVEWIWYAIIEPLNVEELYALTLTVEWVSEGRVRRIRCDTRLRAGQEAETTDTTAASSATSAANAASTAVTGQGN